MRLKDIKMKSKLTGLFFIVGFTPLLILGWWSSRLSTDALMTKSYDELEAVREIKKGQLERFFEEREGDMGVLVNTVEIFREKALNSIKTVLKENVTLHVVTTVNSFNVHELADVLHLLNSLGVKFWRVQPLMSIGRVKNAKELLLQKQTILKLGHFVRQWKPIAAEAGMEIVCGDGLQYLFNGQENTPDRPWRGCPAGWISCGITSDGKVKGCLSMPDELVEGDLRKNDLWDIWFHPDSFSYNRKFVPEQLGPNCSSCDKTAKCKGGCSVNSYATTGIFHNDPYCFYMIDKLNSMHCSVM